MATQDQLCAMMRAFISGVDRSLTLAGEIEVALDDLFGEGEPFASVALALASYRPEGGEFLYGWSDLARMMAPALQALEREEGAPTNGETPSEPRERTR